MGGLKPPSSLHQEAEDQEQVISIQQVMTHVRLQPSWSQSVKTVVRFLASLRGSKAPRPSLLAQVRPQPQVSMLPTHLCHCGLPSCSYGTKSFDPFPLSST